MRWTVSSARTGRRNELKTDPHDQGAVAKRRSQLRNCKKITGKTCAIPLDVNPTPPLSGIERLDWGKASEKAQGKDGIA